MALMEYKNEKNQWQGDPQPDPQPSNLSDEEIRNVAEGALERDLHPRHLQMIALGGTFGTGLTPTASKPRNRNGAIAIDGMLYITIQN